MKSAYKTSSRKKKGKKNLKMNDNGIHKSIKKKKKKNKKCKIC